jgi:hypothetical protein
VETWVFAAERGTPAFSLPTGADDKWRRRFPGGCERILVGSSPNPGNERPESRDARADTFPIDLGRRRAPTQGGRMTRPEWTDREGSDPGITLLRLFAFLAVALVGWLLVSRRRRRRHSLADVEG